MDRHARTLFRASHAFRAAKRRCRQIRRLYVPSLGEATHPRCDREGYPDWPGRASSKEGES